MHIKALKSTSQNLTRLETVLLKELTNRSDLITKPGTTSHSGLVITSFSEAFSASWKLEFVSVLPNSLWEIQVRNVPFIWEEEGFDPLSSSYWFSCLGYHLLWKNSSLSTCPAGGHAQSVSICCTANPWRHQGEGLRLACRLQNWMMRSN